MKRRHLLLATLAPLALAACGGAAGPLTPAGILSNAGAIVNGLAVAIPELLNAVPTLIPAATGSRIMGYLTQAQTILATVTANLPAAQGATLLAQVEGYINSALTDLAAFPLIPPPFSTYIAAASALLPVLEAFINVTLGRVSTVAASRAARITMTADQARLLLRQAAAR